MKASNSLALFLALASFWFVHEAAAQRAYTRTHSVKAGENFIWCASYEESAGTVWWRVGRVLSTADLAHPTLAAPIGSGSAQLAMTGTGPYNREEVGYGWPERTWLVPLNAPKGLYAAEFSSDPADWSGAAIVYFVIRPPSRSSSTKILFCYPFSTTLAYAGAWGSHVNLYDSFQPARARRVSLDRPLSDPKEYYTVHAPFLLHEFIKNLPGNPEVDACTSFDLNNDPNLLNGYSLFISAGHDEYWSKEMRDHVEGFVASGGNAAFFSANTAWWQVRFRNGNRMMVCHKSGVEDPLAGVDDIRVTGNFASSPAREENTLTGVSYRRGTQGPSSTPFTILDPDDPFLSGVPGPTFGSGLFGLETDAADYEPDGAGGYRVTGRDGSPLNFKLLAVADMSSEGLAQSGRATMGYFKNHGTTFTAATTDWCLHLGDPAVARITRNVVTILSERIPGPAWTLPTRIYPGAAWSFVENVGAASAIAGIVHGQLFLSRSGAFVQKDPENPSVASSATAIPAVAGLTCLGSDLWGRLLYAGTADQGILYRGTDPANPAAWAGHVAPPSTGARCEGIGAITDQLFALFRDGTDQQLYQLMPQENWVRLGHPAPEFQAMTAFDGKLFGASADGLYCRESTSVDLVWTRIGSLPAGGTFSLGAYYGRLFALSGSRVGAALHWHAAVAECQSPFRDPQMLFLRGSVTALGRLAGNGDFETLGASAFTGGYTHVTRANDALVLFYNRSDGSGSVVRYSDGGGQSVLKDYPAGSFGDWTHIVSVSAGPAGLGTGKVLFYNSGATLGIIGHFDPADGAFHSEWDSSAFATGWSHILSTHNGVLFFYNELTGDGAWGRVTSAGVFSTEGTVSGLLTGWEQIVPAGNGFLFFYNSTGQAALAEVSGSFRTVQSWAPGGFGSNWRLGAAANGLVLFYNPVSGGGITGGFNAAGFLPLHTYPDGAFASGWERMVTLDHGFLPALTRLSISVHPVSGYFIRLQCLPYSSSSLQRAASPTGPWTTLTTYTTPQSGFTEYHETNLPPGQAFYRSVAQATPR